MPKITDIIKNVVADKKITRDEWDNQVKPELKDAKKATAETREVLELWANDEFEAEPGVRDDMRFALRRAGYDIPTTAVPKKDLVQGILDSNMTETDQDFALLLQQTGKGTAKTTIAVLDAGFQLDHPAFADKEWTNPGEIADNGVDDDKNGLVDDVHGWDFAGGDKDVTGEDHGSHVSGTATRGTDRIQEIACRAFDPLDPVKVAAAIDYACANGARAINMSFKVNEQKEVDIIGAAIARHPDVLFVKSAGNDGEQLTEGKQYGGGWYGGETMTYGAATYLPMSGLPNVVVVAAADAKGERADYSNWGLPYVTVAMRGSEVYSSVPGSSYEDMDGTSMSSPNVTNLAAKCLSLAPQLTPYDVRQILIDATDKKDTWKDSCVAGGMVNPVRAMRLAALVGLVKVDEMTPQAAADKLGLTGKERDTLLALVGNYPVATPAMPTFPPPAPVVTPPATPPDPPVTPVVTPPATPTNPPVTPVVTPPATPADPPVTPVVTPPATPADPPVTPVVTPPATPADPPVTTTPVATTPATPADPAPVTPTKTPTEHVRRRRVTK